jgi:hypothetical protein
MSRWRPRWRRRRSEWSGLESLQINHNSSWSFTLSQPKRGRGSASKDSTKWNTRPVPGIKWVCYFDV